VTLAELLALLRARAAVRLVDGQLEIEGPRNALSPELRAEVAARKHELVAALEAEAADLVGPGTIALAVARPVVIGCRHPHVIVSDGVAECQRCDMRRRLPLADEADAPAPDGEAAAAQLVADGRGIIAALAHRGISMRLGEDGRPLVGPAELIDEADRALLVAHRDAVLAALHAQALPVRPEPYREDMAGNREYLSMLHIDVPGDDPQVIDQIAAVLARHPGSDAVELHIVSGGREVTMQVGERFRVTAGPEVKAALDACFGREVARLEPAGQGPVAEDDAVMPGVGPAAGTVLGAGDPAAEHGAPTDAGMDPATEQSTDAVSTSHPPTVLQAHSMAAGGLVPGQEGRPASTGAEPTGGSPPGTAAPLALFDGSKAQRRDVESGGGEPMPRIEAGAQAFDAEPVLLTTSAELERALPEVLAAPALGFDTEGTGLDPLTAKVRLVQLATGRRAYLIDVFRLPLPALQPVLDQAQRLVGHNLKFDLRMLMAAGIRLSADIGRRMSDTMLAGQLLGAGLDGQRHRLADLAQRYLGIELDKTEQVSEWSGELTADQLTYAARDAAVLLPLRDRLRLELERAGLNEAAGIEHRALPAMVWLEQTGAPFDQPAWLRLAEIAEERRRQLEHQLDAMAPSHSPTLPLSGLEEGSTRWSSPAQVRKLLASRGVVLPDTRDETLHEHHDDDPLIPVLLEHRDAAKRAGAFGRDFLRFVHPVTERIHSDYFQLGSAAGRMSCRSPNLQQIPYAAEYRACFRAPEGRVLVGADFSQIEPRISAEISGEERLLAAYRDRRDVYRQVASELGVERSVAKTIVLGALYGLGARGLVRRLKADAGIEMDEMQARSYLDAFFAGYPALNRWRSGRRGDGPVATRTLSGRRRLNVEDYTRKINTPIQGSAADVFKTAMALLYESRDVASGAHLVLSVHDELVLEVGETEAEVARHWLARCMREAGQIYLERVPVVVEVGVGSTWADTKKTAAPVEEVDEWAA
jgi:DNA polymerase I